MRCPLADTHDYEPVGDDLVCRDCDDVAAPFGAAEPDDLPAAVLILTGGW